VDRADRREWRVETSSIYTVRSAYKLLSASPNVDLAVPMPSLWHKNVPLKVGIFAWRLFRDRLPTKDNLFRRHVIAADAQTCSGECGEMETSSHLFLHCDFFGSVWHLILRWLGIFSVMHCDVSSHFNHSASSVVLPNRSNIFYRLFGLQLFGKYGKKEITGYLMIENAQFFRLWTKSSRHLSCG
jgi:hypothetical protein